MVLCLQKSLGSIAKWKPAVYLEKAFDNFLISESLNEGHFTLLPDEQSRIMQQAMDKHTGGDLPVGMFVNQVQDFTSQRKPIQASQPKYVSHWEADSRQMEI